MKKVLVIGGGPEELPELNDEFASEASEFDTLDELIRNHPLMRERLARL